MDEIYDVGRGRIAMPPRKLTALPPRKLTAIRQIMGASVTIPDPVDEQNFPQIFRDLSRLLEEQLMVISSNVEPSLHRLSLSPNDAGPWWTVKGLSLFRLPMTSTLSQLLVASA